MQHLGEICMAQRSRGKCGRNAYCVKARRDFQTAGLNGVLGTFAAVGKSTPRLRARRADVGIRPYTRLSVVIP